MEVQKKRKPIKSKKAKEYKIIIVGDTHGRTDWKTIVNLEEPFDKFVFIGDYFDSFDISFDQQVENFRDIVAFKRGNMEKVVLLLGNHDFHYLEQCGNDVYSGFQHAKALMVNHELQPIVNEGLIQLAYSHEDILFTHAGVTQTWVNESGLVDSPKLATAINELFRKNPEYFRFNGWDPSGDNKTQGSLWVRPRSLALDMLPTWRYIVGHTRVIQIAEYKGIYLIDCLENNTKQYVEILGNEIKIKSYALQQPEKI